MEVTVKISKDKNVVLNIPYHVSEITYNDFIDMKKAEENFRLPDDAELNENEAVVQNEAIEDGIIYDNSFKDDVSNIDYVSHYTEVVSFIVKGDLSDIPFSDDDTFVDGGMKELGLLAIGSSVTLIKLYWHIVTLVNSYTGEFSKDVVERYAKGEKNILQSITSHFSVNYKGETYYIEPDRAKRMLSLKGYTVGEVLEVEEFERYYKREIEKLGDKQGSFEMALDMSVMAVLLRKDGEKLPIRKLEREQFIATRGRHFGGLGMDVVLRCLFFSGLSQIELKQILPFMLQFTENQTSSLQEKNGKKRRRRKGDKRGSRYRN